MKCDNCGKRTELKGTRKPESEFEPTVGVNTKRLKEYERGI